MACPVKASFFCFFTKTVGSNDDKWLIQDHKLVALGEVDEAGDFQVSHQLSRDMSEINDESVICSFPVGMKVKATVINEV